MLPSLKPATIDKTRKVLAERLKPSQSVLVNDMEMAHDAQMLANALIDITTPKSGRHNGDIAIIFGASAIIDKDDVIPAAIRLAGGTVEHFGMPVDPGNLLLIGDVRGTKVIGAPGCARANAENGFDWVLNRLLADFPVTREAITGMGVGGLLMEIHSRPQPREGAVQTAGKPRIAAIILAAGQSRRMGKHNKLLAQLGGKSLVRHVVEAVSRSTIDVATVVIGHEPEKIMAELDGFDVNFTLNEDYADGLSTSLKTGILNLASVNSSAPNGETFDGALILLADMPGITAAMIDSMVSEFDPANGKSIIQATDQGKRGNPVLWASRYFSELLAVSGDVGARHLLGKYADEVATVELGRAASLDLDTPEVLKGEGGKLI